MEVKGEQTIKKRKKSPKWKIIVYIICIITIVGLIFLINHRKEKATSEAIDFTKDGAVGMETGKLAYLDVQGLSEEIAIYGDTENKNNSSNDRYCIAFNKGYMYIVDLDFEKMELLKPWKEYVYSEEIISEPDPVRIYGTTEKIPNELKQMALDFCNEDVPEAQQIKMDEFEIYFGSVLLNARKDTVNTTVEAIIIFLAICTIITLTIIKKKK